MNEDTFQFFTVLERITRGSNFSQNGFFKNTPKDYLLNRLKYQNVNLLPYLKNENFDDNSFGDRLVDLILGAKVFSSILRAGVQLGKLDEPVA